MEFLYSFCSSSKGNAAYVGTKEKGILIDAGISLRQFLAHLKTIDLPHHAIEAIFITHEHTDHVSGLLQIQAALKNVPVYASKKTLQILIAKNKISPNANLNVLTNGGNIALSAQCVSAHATPHDGVESQCYFVKTQQSRSLCICTDIGYVTKDIHTMMKECNLVMVESNYEMALLQAGSYPQFLKHRIVSEKGHLSNSDCASEVVALYQQGVERFVLGHLSDQNNRPEIAYAGVVAAMENIGAKVGKDYQLSIAPRINNGKLVAL